MNAPRRGGQGVAGHGGPGLKNRETLPAKTGLFQNRRIKLKEIKNRDFKKKPTKEVKTMQIKEARFLFPPIPRNFWTPPFRRKCSGFKKNPAIPLSNEPKKTVNLSNFCLKFFPLPLFYSIGSIQKNRRAVRTWCKTAESF